MEGKLERWAPQIVSTQSIAPAREHARACKAVRTAAMPNHVKDMEPRIFAALPLFLIVSIDDIRYETHQGDVKVRLAPMRQCRVRNIPQLTAWVSELVQA